MIFIYTCICFFLVFYFFFQFYTVYTPRTIYLGKYENEKYNTILSRVDHIINKYNLIKTNETTFIQPEDNNVVDFLFQNHIVQNGHCTETETAVKTLLNSGIAVHPGVIVKATFVSPFPGVSVVAAATVKGAANSTASNILISSTPPFTSDIHQINGVIHKIDQVLLPQ